MNRQDMLQSIQDIDMLWAGKLQVGDIEKLDRMVTVWLDFFAGVTKEQMEKAVKAYSEKGTPFPPTAPELMDSILADASSAYPDTETFVQRVRRAVIEFGPLDAAGALTFLGDEMWGAVLAVAPWQRICDGLNVSVLKLAWEHQVKQKIKKEMAQNHG